MPLTRRQEERALRYANARGFNVEKQPDGWWRVTRTLGATMRVGKDGASYWESQSLRYALMQAYLAFVPNPYKGEFATLRREVAMRASWWDRLLDRWLP